MPYIDTSVLTAYYWTEARTPAVQACLAQISDPVVSPLVEVELHCAIARHVRSGACTQAAAQAIFAIFRRHLIEPRFRTVPVTAPEYTLACDWIAQLDTPLRVLDALHLATAHANGLSLLTADQAFANAAQALGIPCELLA